MSALIEAVGLAKSYELHRSIGQRLARRPAPALRAVAEVDLAVLRGETLGLIGESGCGKSTLGRLLLRLHEPSAGSIRFDGVDITHAPERALRPLRARMQIIFQDPYSSLNPRRTVREILALPLALHAGLKGPEVEARILAMLDRVGLARAHLDRYPHQFSGGQRQRIGIARALILRPDFVVCDEPVSALDVSVQAQVLSLLRALRAEMGLTHAFHQPRPRRSGASRAPHRGDVSRAHRRGGPARRDHLAFRPSVHARSACRRTQARPAKGRAHAPYRRRSALAAEPATRLSVPPALSRGGPALRARGAAPDAAGGGASRSLSSAQRRGRVSQLIVLVGDPYARGLAQARACPEMAAFVRAAIRDRLAAAPTATPAARAFLAAQRDATARLAPEALAEIAGIAEGFGLAADEVFTFLHANILADLAAANAVTDGCTAFAREGVVAKNRDVCVNLAPLQRLFVLYDPTWQGRTVLALGSLGAPGAWSSGMNSDGLALADTQIPTADHGPGVLRYFLMNRLLATCSNVEEALGAIAALPHSGGGALVLADATGAAAAVELRHGRVDVERSAWVARTNHYTAAADRLCPVAHSAARLSVLRDLLAAGAAAEAILAHGGPGEPLCRPASDAAPTIAGAIWDTRALAARIAFGPPGAAPWHSFRLLDGEWRETHALA